MESGFISVMSMDSPPEWEQIGHTGSGHFEFFKVRRFGALHFVKRPSKAYRHDLVTTESLKKEFYIGYNLNHPSIVRYMRMEEGAIYEEYIDGLTLREMIDNGDQRLRSPEFIERICRQLMDATAYLHSRGVIHNDIKPENVMIARIGDQLKLVDLGCAYTDMWDATQGYTPAYKAPEQESGATNVYTDIFLIGKLMEELAPIAGVSRNWRKFIAKATSAKISDRFASDTEAIASIPGRNRKLWPVIVVASVLLIGGVSLVGIWTFRKESYKEAPVEIQERVLPNTENGSEVTQKFEIDKERSLQTEEGDEIAQLVDIEEEDVIPVKATEEEGENVFVINRIKYMQVDPAKKEVVVLANTLKKGYQGAVVIPSTVEYDHVQYRVVGIDKGAFYDCDKLESLVIEDGPESIEKNTIKSTSLKKLTIPGSIESLEDIQTNSLKELTFSGDGLLNISNFTYSTQLTELHLPGSLIYISGMSNAKRGLMGEDFPLKKIVLGKHVKSIVSSFNIYNGSGLEIPSSCRGLYGSFVVCKYLKNLTLGDSIEVIDGSFQRVGMLGKLVIPNSCLEIRESFLEMDNLETIYFGRGLTSIESSFKALERIGKLVIPSNCKTIDNSFGRLDNLKELVIENGVEAILSSFEELPQLKKLTIPGSCKKVSGFNIVPSLEELIIEEGVEIVTGFTDCKNLKKVVLPKSLKSVDESLRKRVEELQK